MNIFTPRRAAFVAASAATLALAGCGADTPTADPAASGNQTAGDKISVVAAFYPLQFAAERVGGDEVTVSNLTLPGAEPHDLELKPQQIADLSKADLVIYQKGFQANVDKAVEQAKPKHVLDVSQVATMRTVSEEEAAGAAEDHDHAAEDHDHEAEGHDHEAEDHDHEAEDHDHSLESGSVDPHQWLDVTNMDKISDAVAKELTSLQQDKAATFSTNVNSLHTEFADLDKGFDSLKTCKRTEFVTSHAAFGYLAERYGLTQIGISGLSPDEEPSPARIAEVQELAKDHGVTTIFYETLVSPKVAQSIAGDLGLKTDVLDPLEGITDQSKGDDYIAVMKSNLEALKKANECN